MKVFEMTSNKELVLICKDSQSPTHLNAQIMHKFFSCLLWIDWHRGQQPTLQEKVKRLHLVFDSLSVNIMPHEFFNVICVVYYNGHARLSLLTFVHVPYLCKLSCKFYFWNILAWLWDQQFSIYCSFPVSLEPKYSWGKDRDNNRNYTNAFQ